MAAKWLIGGVGCGVDGLGRTHTAPDIARSTGGMKLLGGWWVAGWLSGWMDFLEINREEVWPSYGWNGRGEREKFSREQVEWPRGSWEDVVVPAES